LLKGRYDCATVSISGFLFHGRAPSLSSLPVRVERESHEGRKSNPTQDRQTPKLFLLYYKRVPARLDQPIGWSSVHITTEAFAVALTFLELELLRTFTHSVDIFLMRSFSVQIQISAAQRKGKYKRNSNCIYIHINAFCDSSLQIQVN
jgi:hypothetical protein